MSERSVMSGYKMADIDLAGVTDFEEEETSSGDEGGNFSDGATNSDISDPDEEEEEVDDMKFEFPELSHTRS